MADSINSWLDAHGVTKVEAMTPDPAGLPRGKVLPADAFLSAVGSDALRFPSSLYCMTVDGGFVEYKDLTEVEEDLLLIPDGKTITLTPDSEPLSASVICDAVYQNGEPAHYTPRQVLRNLLEKYHSKGWYPVVAPELEFFLLRLESTPSEVAGVALPIGDRGPYGIESVADYGAFFDDLLTHCETLSVGVRTIVREAGKGQFELSVEHTDPLTAADQAFHFKSATRRIARRHGLVASFMARPDPKDFGSAMHIHQSVQNIDGQNLFADDTGADTALFQSYIGGLQRYSSAAMPLLAPYANSYQRIGSDMSAPANAHWGVENRSVGFRVPESARPGRRVENRIPGADVNPYLAFAATLGCGYLGMVEKRAPSQPLSTSAYERKSRHLPRHLITALEGLNKSKKLRGLWGDAFVDMFVAIKNAEYAAQTRSLSPWELEHLLNNV